MLYTKRTASEITTTNAETTCTSGITDMDGLFEDATAFNQDIGDWDVSSVTRTNLMFANTDVFNQDIGDWNVSRVTTMEFMFLSAGAFNQNLSRWCVTNIASEPSTFGETTFLATNRPKWGTCP